MQMTKKQKAYQKSAWIIRLVFLLAGLMIAGGGIWPISRSPVSLEEKMGFCRIWYAAGNPGSSRRSHSSGLNHRIFQNALFQL